MASLRQEGAPARWVAILLLSTLLVGLTDVCLLPQAAFDAIGIRKAATSLAPWAVGNYVPYVALATLFFLALATIQRVSGWSALRIGLLGAALWSPYLGWMSWFTFSGPRVRDLSYQPLLVGTLFLLMMGGIVALIWVFANTHRSPLASKLWAFTGVLLQGAFLLTNRVVYPNEYEPLHTLLSILAVLTATFAAALLLPDLTRLNLRKRHWIPALTGLALWPLASAWVLSQTQVISWVVYGESAGARYMIASLQPEDDVAAATVPEKPTIANKKVEEVRRLARRKKEAPNILVFSVDNVQADRVGAYGYTKNPTTPNIDRIAEAGVRFTRAYTLFPSTRVFMSSMLLGRRLPAVSRHKMSKTFQETSLTRLLKRRKYRNAVKGVFELTAKRDFRPDAYAIDTWMVRATSKQIRKSRTIPHIDPEKRFKKIEHHFREASKQDAPSFLWVHVLRPHRKGGSFVSSKKHDFGKSLDGKYDSALAQADTWLARIEELAEKHLHNGRDTYTLVMSDHGTGMTRQKKKHQGKTLYDDQVRVPFIISGPGIKPGVIDEPVDVAVDASATILDLVGLEVPAAYDGVSLVPLIEGRALEGAFDDRLIPLRVNKWIGGVYQGHKYIANRRGKSLYDTDHDPLEKENLADKKPELLKKIHTRVRAEHKRQGAVFKENYEGRKR